MCYATTQRLHNQAASNKPGQEQQLLGLSCRVRDVIKHMAKEDAIGARRCQLTSFPNSRVPHCSTSVVTALGWPWQLRTSIDLVWQNLRREFVIPGPSYVQIFCLFVGNCFFTGEVITFLLGGNCPDLFAFLMYATNWRRRFSPIQKRFWATQRGFLPNPVRGRCLKKTFFEGAGVY